MSELQRLGDGEDVDAGMAEAKARRRRFVIRLTSPAQSRRPGQPKEPHSFDKALKAGACSMYRLLIEEEGREKGEICFIEK